MLRQGYGVAVSGGRDVTSGKNDIETVAAGELSFDLAGSDTVTLSDFDALYTACRPELVRYAERRNARDAELMADLALLDVHRATDRLRSDHPRVIWAYLYRSIDNHLRREGAKYTPELRDDLEALGSSYSFEDDVIGHLSLDDMLALLSPNQELALRPKLERNLSAEEIGEEIGKSAVAVRQLQHKAIRRLRRILFVVATVLVALLAAVLSDQDVVVDQSPATSETDQPTTETTAPDRSSAESETLRIPGTSIPPEPNSPSPDSTVDGPIIDGPAIEGAAIEGDSVVGGTAEANQDVVAGTQPEDIDAPETTVLAEPVVASEPETTVPDQAVPAAEQALTTVADQAEAEPAGVADPNRLAGSFALVNEGTGNCVDQPYSQDDGGRVIEWRCAGHTALNQIFVATEGNGGTMLAFAHSDKCLDESDQVVSQWTCHGGDNQLFRWNGAQLQSKGSGLCLTSGQEALARGSTLHTAPCVNSPNQQFRLERYGAQLPLG